VCQSDADTWSIPAARTASWRSPISRRTSVGSGRRFGGSSTCSIAGRSPGGHRPPTASIAATDLFASDKALITNLEAAMDYIVSTDAKPIENPVICLPTDRSFGLSMPEYLHRKSGICYALRDQNG
jgi:hypothetical protein